MLYFAGRVPVHLHGMKIPLALVDDHHLVREGIAAMVNTMDGYHVALQAGNGEELIEALATAREQPKAAIVDLNMPVMDGYATVAWLRQHRPDLPALVLTFDATDDAMARAVRMGARGYLLKDIRPAQLREALDSVLATGYYYSREVAEKLAGAPALRAGNNPAHLERITERELEFLRLVCDEREFTYDQIAERMGVHRRTVDNFRSQLFEKFGLKSKTGLVLFALRWGLLG